MTPGAAIAALDRALVWAGEPVRLQRLAGVKSESKFECAATGLVRGYAPSELIAGSGLVQGDTLIILSPTDLTREGWPDPLVPTVRDKIQLGGTWRAVKAPVPFYMQGILVRIELVAAG